MSTGGNSPAGDMWIAVARGATLRGSKGLLTARLLSPGTNPFRVGQRVALRRAGEQRELLLQNSETYRDKVVLKLEGIGSAALAAPLIGSDILLQSKDLVDLPEGTYYIFRLVGFRILGPGGRPLGQVVEVVKTGGTDLLRVRGEAGEEHLIPFARSICRRIDPDAGIIEIDPPEGLLENHAI